MTASLSASHTFGRVSALSACGPLRDRYSHNVHHLLVLVKAHSIEHNLLVRSALQRPDNGRCSASKRALLVRGVVLSPDSVVPRWRILEQVDLRSITLSEISREVPTDR